MDEIITRKAGIKDLPVLLEFEQGIVCSERPIDPTLKEGKINYYDLQEMINDEHIRVVVAQTGQEIIGSGFARIEKAKNYLNHPYYAYLGFMYVKPEYRRKGVNNLIIDALKQWCREKNITELRLEVYEENIPAVKAYEKVGFKGLLVTMRMGLNNGL